MPGGAGYLPGLKRVCAGPFSEPRPRPGTSRLARPLGLSGHLHAGADAEDADGDRTRRHLRLHRHHVAARHHTSPHTTARRPRRVQSTTARLHNNTLEATKKRTRRVQHQTTTKNRDVCSEHSGTCQTGGRPGPRSLYPPPPDTRPRAVDTHPPPPAPGE